jgi:DNA-binding winged helix-turn-helix (wHTH) protein
MFELDLDAQQLSRAGRIVKLQPQPFKLLCLLASRAGEVVSREEIRSALWADDTFVDVDQGVNYAIRQIRDGLGEDAENPVYIQTIPRRGYRFIAPVADITGNELPPIETPSLHLSKLMWANIFELRQAERHREARWRRLKRAGGIGAAVAIAVAAVWLLLVLL